MKKRSIVATFGLALLLVLVFAGAASADKPAVYWHKADVWVEAADSWSPGVAAVNWTEPATVPYGYTIYLDGPTSYSRSVPGWAPSLLVPASSLADGRYKVLIVAYDSDLSTLDRLHSSFVYPVN